MRPQLWPNTTPRGDDFTNLNQHHLRMLSHKFQLAKWYLRIRFLEILTKIVNNFKLDSPVEGRGPFHNFESSMS